MKRGFILGAALIAAGLSGGLARADSVVHTWDGTGLNSPMVMEIDDHGGSFANGGANGTYALDVDGIGVVSTLTFLLYNGTAVDDGADDNDSGSIPAVTGEDFINGSGLTILEPPSELTPPITEIGALSDGPLTPFSFQGRETGLDVSQLTYVQNDKNFIIFEYQVSNHTGATVPVKIALAGDFDVADENDDDMDGKDLSVPMVFEQDTVVNGNGRFYAPGLAVAGGNLDNYRLGSCCDTTFNPLDRSLPDINRLHYFEARPNEACDDSNTVNGDGCSADCKVETGNEVCGNGQIEAGEGCDDSNTNNGDGCSDVCLSEHCGDGILDADEECDDNNTGNDDGCSPYCTFEFVDSEDFCGDGELNDGGTGDQQTEASDNEITISIDLGSIADGGTAGGAFCIVGGFSDTDGPGAASDAVATANDCITLYQSTIAICGNGMVNGGEQCDDGNTVDGDACASNCTLPGCGNGVVETGESCDDGNTTDGDACSADCQTASASATCGDGVVDDGEQCDDGNDVDNDSCSNVCASTGNTIQFGGSGCALALPAAGGISVWGAFLAALAAVGTMRFRRFR